jgi:hypothetical protein
VGALLLVVLLLVLGGDSRKTRRPLMGSICDGEALNDGVRSYAGWAM